LDTVASIVLHAPEQLKRRFFNYIGYIALYDRFNASYELQKTWNELCPAPKIINNLKTPEVNSNQTF
jgi:hypothetical protein